ncbi:MULTISPECIES: efflux RND transporter periplasmic adaptor subunit [Rhodomicrobium]|uniref:efflux RND transporter periplasmic adaptor subunit n=1 Tax=Rhodomicrobium TaxID=1068 RepID=UPI000B4B3752|nr:MULTISPECIES: efflux RND transporter periplasmic adaptor subunit [Rhodomicrobium]
MKRAAAMLPVVAGLIALSACKDTAKAPPDPVRPVYSVVVAPEPRRSLTLAGTIEPQFKTDLSFRVLGRIIARPVDVADLVKKGQVLAAIDPTALELAVRAAVADLSNAQAQLVNAFGTEDRQRQLLETNVTSKATYEAAQQALAAAQSNVVRAQANLTKAREQLGYAQLASDFDGVVTATPAEIGQVVSPGQPVVTVARPEVREAVIDVPDALVGPIKIGMPFEVAFQLDPAIRVPGKVREIAPQADAITRTRRVKITLQNPPAVFRIGTTVTASATTDAAPTLRLPQSAILDKDGKSFVWIVDPKTHAVSPREVRLGAVTPPLVTILSGVEPGDRVVTAGVHSLTDGETVKIDQGDLR